MKDKVLKDLLDALHPLTLLRDLILLLVIRNELLKNLLDLFALCKLNGFNRFNKYNS